MSAFEIGDRVVVNETCEWSWREGERGTVMWFDEEHGYVGVHRDGDDNPPFADGTTARFLAESLTRVVEAEIDTTEQRAPSVGNSVDSVG